MTKPSMHIIGIGGTAMVAGARLALEAGWEVRGSDNPLYPPTSDMVAALGVHVYEGYAAENLDWEPDVVLVGNALSRGNAEVEAVLDRRMRYMSLPEWTKANVLQQRKPIVAAGTHGKTTTTTMAAFLLDQCGMNPGYLIGGQPLCFEHSSRLGAEGAPFVIEGDEYDTAFFDKRAKFLHYLPEIAIVTSLEFDHGDIYRDLEEIEIAFQRLLRQIPARGWLLACADNHARSLVEHAPCNVATYGFSDDADWRVEVLGDDARGQRLRIHREGTPLCETTLPLPGTYNALNACAAFAASVIAGADPHALSEALPTFAGVRRRMEVFHEGGGHIFVDDFAHHPTAIAEAIAAARSRWPEHHLSVCFEPRSNTTVTKEFQKPLAESLAGADSVWLGPIYREERIPKDERLDRTALAGDLEARGVGRTAVVDDVDQIVEGIRQMNHPHSLVLIISNGAFGGIYSRIKESIPSQN